MKKVILPLGEPFIDYTPRYNNLTSIISTTDQGGIADLVENFINIEYEYEATNHDLWQEFDGVNDWSRFKSIEVNVLARSFFKSRFRFAREDFEDILQEGYYIYLNALPHYNSAYTKCFEPDFPHEILIYGYDRDKQVFYCQDFFDKIRCRKKECKNDELFESICRYDDIKQGYAKYLNDIILIKKSSSIDNRSVSLDLIYHKLKLLLLNKQISSHRPFFGYSWFDFMIRSISDFDSLNKWWLNEMSLIFLREHMKLMFYRMNNLKFGNVNCQNRLYDGVVLCISLLRKNIYKYSNFNKTDVSCNDRITTTLLELHKNYYDYILRFCVFIENL